MKCQRCHSDLSNNNFCENCNIDALIYNKVTRISNNLYNKALYEVLSKNLFDAINLLNKSIYFNKNNYKARNLLGLIYFYIGRVGEALKHWIISSSIKKEDNVSLRYIKIVEENEKNIEILNNAIEMYNQALIYMRQKNDDLAIIQLKKAIEISPNFIEAMNLLSFCYLVQNKKREAENMILKVLKIDDNNNTALYYYRKLFPKEQRPKKEQNIIINKIESKTNYLPFDNKSKLNNKDIEKKIGDNFHTSEIISFIVGVIFTSIFMYILIIPGILNNKENKIIKLENNINNLEKKYKSLISDKNEKIKTLEEENNIITLENQKFKEKLSREEIDILMKEVNNYFSKGNYEKAADILSKIDESKIKDEFITIYTQTKNKVYKFAGQQLYNKGLKEYNLKNYDISKELFEKSLLYSPEEAKYLENEIFYLAKIAENNNNKDLAIEYYKKIIEKYPNSSKSKASKERIEKLNNS